MPALVLVGGAAVQNGIPAGADAAALAEYRGRVLRLDDEIAEAERCNDLGRAERLRHEKDTLLAEIGKSVGLGGKQPVTGDATELARISALKAIQRVYAKVRPSMPVLVHHLETHVKTGHVLIYRPDPARPVVWNTR